MFENFFKTSWRNLQRNRIYSIINMAGLSLGLACAMLIILYIKDEVSYDRFHANVNHIYRIAHKTLNPDGSLQSKGGDGNTGYFQGPKFKAAIPEIQSYLHYQNGQVDIKNGTEVFSQEMFYTDSNFFSVFSFPLLSGNPKTALLGPNSIVISENLAKRQFGAANAVGKTILVKDNDKFTPYTVTAVAKKCPQNSSIKFDVLMRMNISAADQQDNTNWLNFFMNTFAVLTPEANIEAVDSKMQKAYEADAKETIKLAREKYGMKESMIYFLQPFTDMHLNREFTASNGLTDASNPVYSYILSGIALFILLIACINFVNLAIARSLKRAREIGIRKVVGGNRKQLIIQFLGESFIFCFVSFILALAIVQAVLPVFNELSNKTLSLSYLLDIKLVASYITLFIITALLAGFYPAIVLSGYNPVQTLYSRFNLSGKNYLQKTLVVIQFSLASFLIVATYIIYSQFNFLTTEKLGYDDSNLVMVDKFSLKRGEAKLLKEKLTKNPNIADVTFKNGGRWGTIAKVNADSTLMFDYETVDEFYLPLLKIPVVLGRNFSPDYPSDSSNSVLVNESFVKKAGWIDPIGQDVNFWYQDNKKYKVVGVIKDYHFLSLNEKISPQLFTMKKANDYGLAIIKIRPNSATASLRNIEKTFRQLFPFSPFTYKFKDQENLRNYESEAKWKQIMLFSAILTIFISSIGLFGLSVSSTERRTKEIGIRKVLGASVNKVVTTLTKDFLKLVIIALLLAIPLSWFAANKWLENYPYRITLHWGMFALSGLLVVFIALATVSFQAIKAAVANPVKSLRTE